MIGLLGHSENVVRQKAAELLGVVGPLKPKKTIAALKAQRAQEKDIAVIDTIIAALNKVDIRRDAKELAKTEKLEKGTAPANFKVEDFRDEMKQYGWV